MPEPFFLLAPFSAGRYPLGKGMSLSGFDPLVSEWFETRFGAVTDPQRLGWPEIRTGRDVLISAPTGTAL